MSQNESMTGSGGGGDTKKEPGKLKAHLEDLEKKTIKPPKSS